MAKEKKSQQPKAPEAKPAKSQGMSLEESRAHRASLYKPSSKPLSEAQKKEAFRIFWTSNKAKYGKGKALETALWLHLKTIKMDSPEQFTQGLQNFGLKKVK
jgi:hypothetical protein